MNRTKKIRAGTKNPILFTCIKLKKPKKHEMLTFKRLNIIFLIRLALFPFLYMGLGADVFM